MDYEIEGTSRKKMKQTLEMESPSRYSSINELIASHSSMDGYLVEESHKKEESCKYPYFFLNTVYYNPLIFYMKTT